MNVSRIIRAGLVGLFLASLPALAATTIDPHKLAPAGAVSHVGPLLVIAALGLVGTASLAYKTPGSGTTPATAAQARLQQIQVVEVTFVDADTTAAITHNMGIGTTGASPTTAQDLPKVSIVPATSGTAFPGISAAWTDGNTVTLTKTATTVGTGCVVTVYLEKPHSIVGPR